MTEYYYSGTESLWCGNWNHLACRRWKCEVDHPSQSTEVNLGKKRKWCSLWCPRNRNIFATAYWILLLKPSFVISQGQPCWHAFHASMSAKNKRPIKCVKPQWTPLYFHSSHAWYAWLLYKKIQRFFLQCVRMHECNYNFAFPSHSSIYTAIINIHCFFFPLV